MPIDIDLPDFKIVCYCDKPSHMVRMRMREDQNVDLIYTPIASNWFVTSCPPGTFPQSTSITIPSGEV